MIRFSKPTIDRKDMETVLHCMITDDLAPGDYMREFRRQLARLLGLSTAVVFNTYVQAFDSAFDLIGAKPGDEVILSSYTRFRIYHALVARGLTPVPVDIGEGSLIPTRSQIERTCTEKTACIILQQLFGIPHDLSSYSDLGVPLIEDLDGALCSRVGDSAIGSFGDLVSLNFNDDAVITTGNGGMLASNDKALKRLYESYEQTESSLDYLMSDFNASLGISQLKKLEKNCERRRRIGEFYDQAVMASSCSLLGRSDSQDLAYSSYPVHTASPFEDCERFFKRYDIPLRRGIERPVHQLMGLPVADFPRTEEMFGRVVMLPLYPTMERAVVDNVAKGIRAIL